MRQRLLWIVLIVLLVGVGDARAAQTIVFLRHGEKPSGGYGQLTCQGFNRALALPTMLVGRFGKPTLLYAPNPSVRMVDSAGTFYYVRPLATVEPTAIKYRLPVNTKYAYNDIASLKAALVHPTKDNTTIFVVWEHDYLQKVVQSIMNSYGGGTSVPAWITGDYDSLYVVRVDYSGGRIMADFHKEKEGLNGQPAACSF
jgi:hypothetical protein